MDSISAVARPAGEVKGQYHKERETKIAPNFANQNWLFMATTLERFLAVQLMRVRLPGFEGGAPRAWRFFFLFFFSKKITHFKHILIQVVAWNHDLKLL